MFKLFYFIPVSIFVGCSPAHIPTQAIITRFEADALRACQVHLGMTVSELVAQCGKPDRIVPWIGHPDPDRCLIYETKAIAFNGPAGAPFVGACTGVQKSGSVLVSQDSKHRIIAVFGLRESVPLQPEQAP